METGAELFTDVPDAEINENEKFGFEIALGEPEIIEAKPILETLIKFRDYVNGVVRSFRDDLA